MTKIERVAIYIDGNNFYGYLKNSEIGLRKGQKCDLNKLVDFLAHGRKIVSKRYYVGIARNIDGSPTSFRIVRGQQKFLAKIENQGFTVKRGRVMYDKGRIREKGVDVKIAVDLIVGAIDDQ